MISAEEKAAVDARSLFELLRVWRFAPAGDLRMQGEHGDYWRDRMFELRRADPDEWTRVSKEIGWEK